MERGADGGHESPLAPRLGSCSLQHLGKPAALLRSDLRQMNFAGAWCTSGGPWKDWVVQLHQRDRALRPVFSVLPSQWRGTGGDDQIPPNFS